MVPIARLIPRLIGTRLVRFGFILPWLLGVVVSTGCTTQPHHGLESVTASESKALISLDFWRMEGRIGVQSKTEAWHAHISWEHESLQDRLLIQGPLNQGLVSIVLRKGLIYINDGHGEGVLSREPELALRKRLGFSVPLYSLRYWVMGLPDPAAEHTVLSDPSADYGFGQSGWLLGMDDYKAIGGYKLPGRLKIQGSEVKLKLVIDNWNLEGHP